MLSVGDPFPAFQLDAVLGGPRGLDPEHGFVRIDDQTDAGRWRLIFFWPRDFSTLCPTEIIAFDSLHESFADADTVIYGISSNSEHDHFAWRTRHPALRVIRIPMLADVGGVLAASVGILSRTEPVAMRATFLVDPAGTIRYVAVVDIKVARNPQEVLRVLYALQSDELCPCDWSDGADYLETPVETIPD